MNNMRRSFSIVIHGALIVMIAFALIGGICSISSSTHIMPESLMSGETPMHCSICPIAFAPHIAFLHHELRVLSVQVPDNMFYVGIFFWTNMIAALSLLHSRFAYKINRPPSWRSYLDDCFSRGILNPKCA